VPRTQVKQVSAGGFHTCAVLDDHSLKCFGRGHFGQLGSGGKESLGDDPGEMGDHLPTVNLGNGRSAWMASAGQVHTCAVLDDASVKCFGSGMNGRLGSGGSASLGDEPNEMGDHLLPIDLGPSRSAKSVAAGEFHT